MLRVVLALTGILFAVNTAVANTLPVPMKVIPLDHKITTDKEFPDYNFYLVGKTTVLSVQLDPKTPVELKSKPTDKETYHLIALPKETAKQFASEKELHQALLSERGVKGQLSANGWFDPTLRVLAGDVRTRAFNEKKVDQVDAKKGIMLTTPAATPTPGKKDSPDEGDSPTAISPRGGTMIAGLSAFAAMTLSGLWLTGRARRKV